MQNGGSTWHRFKARKATEIHPTHAGLPQGLLLLHRSCYIVSDMSVESNIWSKFIVSSFSRLVTRMRRVFQAEIKLEYLPQLLKDPLGCTKQSNVSLIYGTTMLSSLQLRKEDLVKQGLWELRLSHWTSFQQSVDIHCKTLCGNYRTMTCLLRLIRFVHFPYGAKIACNTERPIHPGGIKCNMDSFMTQTSLKKPCCLTHPELVFTHCMGR